MSVTTTDQAPAGYRIWTSPNRVDHLQPTKGPCATCGSSHTGELDARARLAALPIGAHIRARVPGAGVEHDAIVTEHHGTHIWAVRRHLPADDLPARAAARARMVVSGAAVSSGLVEVSHGWADEARKIPTGTE